MKLSNLALVLMLATSVAGTCRSKPARRPTPSVGTIDVLRGGITLGSHGDDERLRGSRRIPADGTIRGDADARSLLRLDAGATVLVDRSTEVVVHLDRVELRTGRLFVDARASNPLTIETAEGTLRVEGASASVKASRGRTEAYAAAGEITYASPRGSDRFAQGELLALGTGEPKVEPAAVFDDWTGGLATPARLYGGAPTYIGAVDARVAGAIGVAGEPMSLRSHEVVATVTDDAIRTETIQTFFNGESEMVDGFYRVRIPDGSVVESFEVDRGGGFESSLVSPIAAADVLARGAAFSGGSARLVFDGPGRYRARITTIPPGASLRVKLVTTSWLERRAGVRTLTIPLADESESPLVGEMSIRVDASHAGAKRVTAGYGANVDGKLVAYRASDVKPRADFVVELFDEAPRTTIRAYEGSRSFERGRIEHFVRLDIPTDVLVDASTTSDAPLDLLVVLDTSGSTDDEDLELARATIETLLAQTTRRDRIAVRAGDVRLRAFPGSPTTPSELDDAARMRLLESIATVETGGATDLGTILREAAASLAGHANGAVLYLGDGVPSEGAMSATALSRELDLVDDPPRLFAIGLGDDANLGLLRAVVGDGATGVRDRDEAAREILRTLAAAGRPVVRGVRIDPSPSLEQVFPRHEVTVPVGHGTAVLARVQGELPTRITVRGRDGTRAIERTFEVERREGIATADVPARWASARLRELLDSNAGREAIVELGLGFGLVTPYTPRVVGIGSRVDLARWAMLDDDPARVAWSLTGGTPTLSLEDVAGPRGFRAYESDDETAASALESTWQEHDLDVGTGTPSGDGGLALASVARVLALGGRGPQGCFERKLLQRPDLAGDVLVSVTVDGTGRVVTATVVRSTLGVEDVDRCVLDEVRGLSFPATGTTTVTVTHTYRFAIPGRRVGIAHRCSLASERDLESRKRLWAEAISVQVQNGGGADGLVAIFNRALSECELPDWRSRRSLATMMLRALTALEPRLSLYRSFADDPVVAPYLRREILAGLRSGGELARARVALGLDPNLDYRVFTRALLAATTSDAKIALVRRWLTVAPDDLDLRLRLLALLEETGKLPEAERVARALHADPLADARARTLVGEFWLRHDERDEAVRVFSELVERAPLDPWARRRLGDLYLAHGFVDDARREYATLARLVPDDSTNLLLLARAAASSGRTDESLRLEQRVSEEADDDVEEGLSAVARAFTTVRIARLRAEAREASERARLDDRLRETGILRRTPDLIVTLVWSHPDDRLGLEWLGPGAVPNEPFNPASTAAEELGIASFRVLEREDGEYRIKITRRDARDLRASVAELVVIEALGTPNERTTVIPVTLTKDDRERIVPVSGPALGR